MNKYQAIAINHGSTAKTTAGIVWFFRANPAARKDLANLCPKPMSKWEWKAVQEERKRNPDAKRARDRDDTMFRSVYLRKLRAEEKKLREYDRFSVAGICEFVDTLSGRQQRLDFRNALLPS